jgi:hypothetical protein
MTFGEVDVARAARAARLPLATGDAAAVAAALRPVGALLAALAHVRPHPAGGAVGVGAGGMPLRADAGPPYAMDRPARELAPAARGGFVLVPRLAALNAPGEARPPVRRFDAADAVPDAGGDDALAAELELGA